jgi:hypothetical protein
MVKVEINPIINEESQQLKVHKSNHERNGRVGSRGDNENHPKGMPGSAWDPILY